MSNSSFKTIKGSMLRAELRAKGIPGGSEIICCGGKKKFSRDYESQLKSLGYKGSFKIEENGAICGFITI